MTENEALKIATHCLGVQAEQEVCEECPVYRESGIVCKEIARTAITALEEIQQYRAIGTVEECQEAVEKRKAKIVSDLDYDLGYYTCPSCGTAISFMDDGYKSHKCCLNCGQAIKFYENLEGMEE